MVSKVLTDENGNIHVGRSKSCVEKFGLDGAMFLGKVKDDRKVFLDSLYPHVIFVCGARGSGKSYTLGVIIEGLAEKNANVGCVVIDPVGVFWSLKQANKQEGELSALRDWNLKPKNFGNVKVLVPQGARKVAPKKTFDGTFSLNASELTIDDWCLTFGLDRFEPASLLLERAIRKCGTEYSVDELVRVIGEDEELTSKAKGFSSVTRRGLISRLEASTGWGIFGHGREKVTEIEDITRAGRVCILDTSFLSEEVSSLVVGIITRKILNARKAAARAEALGYKANNIPPTWLCIDEAHTLIPANRKTAASDAIIEYVKQGRRPGCSIVLATQQPAAVNSSVLSQLDLLLIHKLVFHDDIKAVFKRMPSSVEKEMKEVEFVRTLPLGEALLGDREEENPLAFTVRVRPRLSQHEGRSSLAVHHELRELEEVETEAGTETEQDGGDLPKETGTKIQWRLHSKIAPGTALVAAKRVLKKRFIIFRNETIISKSPLLYPVWRVRFRKGKSVGILHVDGLSGEIVFGKNLADQSTNLNAIEKLPPADKRIIAVLGTHEMDGRKLSKKVGLDETTLSRRSSALIKTGFLQSRDKKGKGGDRMKYYRVRSGFCSLPSVETASRLSFAVCKAGEDSARIVRPKIGVDALKKSVTVFEGASLLEADLIYKPLWLFETSHKRRIVVDGLSGCVDPLMAGRLPKRA